MKCNEAGLDIIKRYEGFRARPYLCPAGVWTIGYGHTGGVTENSPAITEADADELLLRDLRTAEYDVTRMVSVPLNENQFSALVSFVFNVGSDNFRTSTLRVMVNRKAWMKAADEFPKWRHAGGKALAGLTERRKEERALFLKPVIV